MNLLDLLQATVIVGVLAAMIRISTPLLLAALGEVVTERSGILNLGVEGMMLTGAFVAFLVANRTGSLMLAILAAMLGGGVMSLIMAYMAINLGVNQVVAGMSLNLLGSGITGFWLRYVFTDTSIEAIPTVEVLSRLKIPFLSKIPYVGEVLFSQGILTYAAFLLVPVVWFLLSRTKYGLRIRSAGEDPRAVDMRGLSVVRLQYAATVFGGAMAGLAGAFVSVGSSIRFVPDMTAGRGWLAIVIVIAGNWKPSRIMLAAMVFAFLDAFQLQLQGVGMQVPYQFLLALPYIVAIVVVMGARARSVAPGHLGLPYARE